MSKPAVCAHVILNLSQKSVTFSSPPKPFNNLVLQQTSCIFLSGDSHKGSFLCHKGIAFRISACYITDKDRGVIRVGQVGHW